MSRVIEIILKLSLEKDFLRELRKGDTKFQPKYNTIHCVARSVVSDDQVYYKDPPRLFEGDEANDQLRGRISVEPPNEYLEAHQQIAFSVVHMYSSSRATARALRLKVGYKDGKLIADSPPAKNDHVGLEIGPILHDALCEIMRSHPKRFEGYSVESLPSSFGEPFFLFYIHNKTFAELVDASSLDDRTKSSVRLLCDWFETNWRQDWDEADELFSRGVYNNKHLEKLFRPNELIVHPIEKDATRLTAAKTSGYPKGFGSAVIAFVWNFNGSFQPYLTSFQVSHEKKEEDYERENKITTLEWYPIRFVEERWREGLVARGAKVWQYRTKKLVCYNEDEASGIQVSMHSTDAAQNKPLTQFVE